MTFGLTGNVTKETLWAPLAALVRWLHGERLGYVLDPALARGLAERALVPADGLASAEDAFAARADVVLSFGGDGTLLRTAHAVGPQATPILGVNIGRLGFLADIETQEVQQALRLLLDGRFQVETRAVLAATHGGAPFAAPWAINEFSFERSGRAGLVALRVAVDGAYLNTYWGDGLIVATPTGSTAYSLSVGGPIVYPTADVLVLSPVAPHTLTVRPIVLPGSVRLDVEVDTRGTPFVVAADGVATVVEAPSAPFVIERAQHDVRLVRLEGQHFFHTLREKLMWGAMGKGS